MPAFHIHGTVLRSSRLSRAIHLLLASLLIIAGSLSYLFAGIGGWGSTASVWAQSQTLNVPFLIQEALSDDPNQSGFQVLPGISRIQEPVTFGMPLADSAGITDINQLGLIGAQIGQFRILKRWPSGNIQWVLIDTQADVNAGMQNTSIALTNGSGNFGGSNLSSDQGSTILI